jgi:predicted GIY-YIG superfamily endonuclease
MQLMEREMTYRLGDLLPSHKGYALQAKAKAIYRQLPMCCVYVVRDGNRIIYVGSTNYRATNRLKQHRAHGSPLGRLMRIDSNSHNWAVDIHPAPDRVSAYALETEMIHRLQPEVN